MANVGLIVFITTVVLNVGGLLLDGLLFLTGQPTVTSAVIKNPWFGVPIILLQVIGTAGLVLHFYARHP